MKSLYEQRGGTYTQVGQYQMADLVLDDQPEGEIGIWGQRRKRISKSTSPAVIINCC